MSQQVVADIQSPSDIVEAALSRLEAGSTDLPATSLSERARLAEDIRKRLVDRSREWVRLCCDAKGITTSAGRSEEILAGPATTARYLTLLSQSLRQIAASGQPAIPGRIAKLADGRLSVPVFPASGVYDSTIFMGLKADVRMQPGVTKDTIHGDMLAPLLSPAKQAPISLVLGAGNVSSIPPTDALSKLFQAGRCVLLKMSPVNDYLTEIFNDIFAPVIDRGWMQIIKGGPEIGIAATSHNSVTDLHITGSHHTHDAIVWGGDKTGQQQRIESGQPVLAKPITSELGNVSPWIFVPGQYSEAQLNCQATNVAASITNNAGFNCLATRIIITWKQWPQREALVNKLRSALEQVPPRVAYYPGARKRFEEFTSKPAPETDDNTIPWTLLTDVNPDEQSKLFIDECFVCIACELALDADSPQAFLEKAAEFCNDRLFGTLCACITLPDEFQRRERTLVDRTIDRLNYGSVCLNQFAGLVYGLMTPPWGGAPGSLLDNVQSGIGSVHNLYFLDRFEKTVLHGPVKNFPKPIWFPSHSRAETVGWKLVDFYGGVSPLKLPGILLPAVLG